MLLPNFCELLLVKVKTTAPLLDASGYKMLTDSPAQPPLKATAFAFLFATDNLVDLLGGYEWRAEWRAIPSTHQISMSSHNFHHLSRDDYARPSSSSWPLMTRFSAASSASGFPRQNLGLELGSATTSRKALA